MKRCEHCGHSRAAHVDGMRCALCGCLPLRQNFVQERFGFRENIPLRAIPSAGGTRKR
jgi:hypothetical protein